MSQEAIAQTFHLPPHHSFRSTWYAPSFFQTSTLNYVTKLIVYQKIRL